MKTLIAFFCLLFLISINCFAQNNSAEAVEIFIGTDSVQNPLVKRITFYFNNRGPVFGYKSIYDTSRYYYVTNYYDTLSYTPDTNDVPTNLWNGWDFVFSYHGHSMYGFGLYKMTTDDSEASF